MIHNYSLKIIIELPTAIIHRSLFIPPLTRKKEKERKSLIASTCQNGRQENE